MKGLALCNVVMYFKPHIQSSIQISLHLHRPSESLIASALLAGKIQDGYKAPYVSLPRPPSDIFRGCENNTSSSAKQGTNYGLEKTPSLRAMST